jgi:hypothetical protein
MQDRRYNYRHPCQSRIGVLYPDGRSELLWAYDVSETGIGFHAGHSIPIGTMLRVVIFLYSPELRKQLQIITQTRVCHCVLDTTEGDFRIGANIQTFEGNGEEILHSQINRLALALSSQDDYDDPFTQEQKNQSYPLHRRIKLGLGDGRTVPGWTEKVSLHNMRASLALRLPIDSIHGLNIPIVLSNVPDVKPIRVKAKVQDVIFRPMGTFATSFQLFDYEEDGQKLLQQELEERFPDLTPKRKEPSQPLDVDSKGPETESLQPLFTKRTKP